MCGIFGIIAPKPSLEDIRKLAKLAEQRGRDSSGLFSYQDNAYRVLRADWPITGLLKKWDGLRLKPTDIIMGHSRLITNGLADNQPVVRDGVCVLHNGIIVNDGAIWKKLTKKRQFQVDTEVIAAIAAEHLEDGGSIEDMPLKIIEYCRGTISCAIALPKLGKLCLFSNNGSLYIGKKNGGTYFSSEAFPLKQVGCADIVQVKSAVFLDLPACDAEIEITDKTSRSQNLIPELILNSEDEKLLVYPEPEFRRCTKCILPETMPFIRFDDDGVCNYCNNYTPRNQPKPREDLMDLLEPFRRAKGYDCIVPFSGGRDSCYGLHLIVEEFKMKPLTYTYDWGMVTDLGRRNISRMTADMGVENIIVAADINKKRKNIAKNLKAWLKAPNLGMVSILTAGDKHFFQHLETIKKQTGISLNLWGTCPLEVTHFKAGFLDVPPNFEEEKVYSNGALKQLRYQSLRFKAMLQSPGYFNRSLWDTVSGEYYRSVMKKTDYIHIFDYWSWEENTVNQTLAMYDWEKAEDTSTTWRIGDGTAAFYNYIYYTVAGFTEHDTFRSNQIREGQITRSEALTLVQDESRPRYANIKWYLDAVGLDFADTIKTINAIPRLYQAA